MPLCVGVYTRGQVPKGARRVCRASWSWSYRWLWSWHRPLGEQYTRRPSLQSQQLNFYCLVVDCLFWVQGLAMQPWLAWASLRSPG